MQLSDTDVKNIISELELKGSVFSDADLAKVLSRHIELPAQFVQFFDQILAADELILLGTGPDGRNRYTTRKLLKSSSAVEKGLKHA